MKVTYYLEVISSWCYWAEPTWAELKKKYAGQVEFDWKLSLMDSSGLPVSAQQTEWFYRRSGTIVRSPFILNSGWYEPELKEYLAPNLVAEAAKDFGVTDDRVRLAIAHAGLREGQKVGRWEVAAQVGAQAANLDPAKLLEWAKSPEVEARARQSTAAFHALQVCQRPTFVLEDPIGDKAVLSGLVAAAPLIATIEAMLSDTAGYASFKSHFGVPPSA